MAKVNATTLKKQIRALNKLKLAGAVKTRGDVDDLVEDFISAIEEIDDEGKIGKVSDDILDFYEELIPDDDGGDDDGDDGDGGGDDDLADELADMSYREVRKFAKDKGIDVGRITAKNKDDKVEEILDALEDAGDDDGDDDGDDGDLEAKLEDMSIRELRAYVKENDVPFKGRITGKNKDDAIEACLDAAEGGGDDDGDDDGDGDAPNFDKMDDDELLDFCDENDIELTERQEGFKGSKLKRTIVKKYEAMSKKSGDSSKSGGRSSSRSSKKDSDKLPTGIRRGTVNADLYEAIADDGAVMKDLAAPLAKKKGKEPHQLYGTVMRTLIRKVAKAVPICATFGESGEEGDIVFTLADED